MTLSTESISDLFVLMGTGSCMLPSIPVMGRSVTAETLMEPGLDVSIKKCLADAALNAAKAQASQF